MARVLVFQHVAAEPLGTLDPMLRGRGHRIRYVNPHREPDAQPDVSRYQALIVLGGPQMPDEGDRYPHLRVEMRCIEEALERDIPVLGICLGAQLLAHALGGAVHPMHDWEIRWHLHFSGHGEKGGSVFRHESGDAHFVPMRALMDMIRATAEDLHLVVLCSCHSTWQAEALTELARCTVGTSAGVLDEAAIAFSTQFYAALVRGDSVKKAFEQGKARAAAETRGSTCEFHLHHREGVDPGQIVLFSPGSATKR